MVEKWKKLTLTLFTVVFLLLIFIVNNVEAINRTSKVVKVGMFKLEGIAEFNNKSIYQNYADKYFSKLTNITGLKFEYVIGSRNEIMKKFAKGELDGVFGVNYNKNYNRKYAYIKPGVFTKNIDLIGLKEGSEKYNSYNKQIDESIAGKVFGVISQYNENYRELLKENIDEKKEFKLNA